MYQNNRRKLPERTDPEYVIYFYESGLSQQYRRRQRNLLDQLDYSPPVGFDVPPDYFTDQYWPVPQTVDDVIRRGYLAVPESEPETATISDKKDTSKLALNDIIDQIQDRYRIYQQNMNEIEVSKCAAINSIYAHEAYHGPAYSRIEYSMNKRLDKLYKDEREERMNLWRDVSRLKLQLPETAQQYLSAYRKVSILEDKEGDTN